MPGFLSLFNEVERVTFEGEYWVDLKKALTVEDYETAQRALLGKMSMMDGKVRATPDTIEYQHELVFRSIVDWNLTDEDGIKLPLNPDDKKHKSIRALPQSVFLELYTIVNASTTPRGRDESKEFRDDGAVSDSGDAESESGEISDVSEVSDGETSL
jgi:hypothetical protein